LQAKLSENKKQQIINLTILALFNKFSKFQKSQENN